MANSYMRTANAAGSLLLRVQTARHPGPGTRARRPVPPRYSPNTPT